MQGLKISIGNEVSWNCSENCANHLSSNFSRVELIDMHHFCIEIIGPSIEIITLFNCSIRNMVQKIIKKFNEIKSIS